MQVSVPIATRILPVEHHKSPLVEGTRVWDHPICFQQAVKISEGTHNV